MSEQSSLTETDPVLRVVMMPRDTNAYGTIFGGVILSYLDQAAFIGARRVAKGPYVTVAMDAIEFRHPVMVGDVLTYYASVVRIGRTSMRLRVSVFADPADDTRPYHQVTEGEIVLVAVDADRRPRPICPDK